MKRACTAAPQKVLLIGAVAASNRHVGWQLVHALPGRAQQSAARRQQNAAAWYRPATGWHARQRHRAMWAGALAGRQRAAPDGIGLEGHRLAAQRRLINGTAHHLVKRQQQADAHKRSGNTWPKRDAQGTPACC